MSEQQPTALLAKIKDDAGLREKLQGAADPNAAVAFAKEAGFEVSKAEWLKAQASQTLELEELSAIAGGGTKPAAKPARPETSLPAKPSKQDFGSLPTRKG